MERERRGRGRAASADLSTRSLIPPSCCLTPHTQSMASRPSTRRPSGLPPFTHALSLPDDVWIEILARLPPADLPAALASCTELHRLAPFAWRALCLQRWSAWSAISSSAGVPIRDWKRQAEFFELRDREEAAVAATKMSERRPAALAGSAPAAQPAAPAIGPRHRAILVEWLAEVSDDGHFARCGRGGVALWRAPGGVDGREAGEKKRPFSRFALTLSILLPRSPSSGAPSRPSSSRRRPTWTPTWPAGAWRTCPSSR